jgi:DNA polymerase-3 subunit epsilon
VIAERVTKKLDLLVVADPETRSGKGKKARDYGTRIIAEPAFWAMIAVEVN